MSRGRGLGGRWRSGTYSHSVFIFTKYFCLYFSLSLPPFPMPHVPIYWVFEVSFLPQKIEEECGLIAPTPLDVPHSSNSWAFQGFWKFNKLISHQNLLWILSFTFTTLLDHVFFLHFLFSKMSWYHLYIVISCLISLPLWINAFLMPCSHLSVFDFRQGWR